MWTWDCRKKSLAHFSTVLISPSLVASLPEKQSSGLGERITDSQKKLKRPGENKNIMMKIMTPQGQRGGIVLILPLPCLKKHSPITSLCC